MGKASGSQPGGSKFASWSPRPWQRGTTLVHRHNARLPGSGQSAVGGTGAGLSDHRATCVTAESWCGRAAGIDGPTWVMATYKIADCTRYIPYPISHYPPPYSLERNVGRPAVKKGAPP
jgi:hypothetical protein